MKKAVFITFILLLAARSCFYVDDSQYWVDIDAGYTSRVTITSSFDTIDSIMIVDSLLFKYEISIDTGEVYFADLYLNNLLIFRSDTVADSLWFYPDYFRTETTYDITLVAYYTKRTGSLADIMDADFLVADTSWTIRFLSEPE
jgi:hypothetical protein